MAVAARLVEIGPVSNDGQEAVEFQMPYVVTVEIVGVAPILFHRWSNEEVEIKTKAPKGSKAKKTDNLEAYVYRNEAGELCIPGEYLRMSMVTAAKFRQDPRSPRKSAMDLYKAAVVSLTELASLGATVWDYEDRRRAVVQRSGITRVRPAFKPGWRATFEMQVLLPEYVSAAELNDVIQNAGKLIGLGDFRPTYGRYMVTQFQVTG